MQKKIPRIQFITQEHPTLSHSEQALLAFQKGIKNVQIRIKDFNKEKIVNETSKALQLAKKYDATIILNDFVEIAREIGLDAVHLGLNDMPINKARQILGNKVVIGGTANRFEDILLQKSQGADYIGIGPFRHTHTKKNLSPLLGIDGYREILRKTKEQQLNVPLIAVGGILLEEVETLIQEGFYGVAISTSFLKTF